jgi:hypothetical protein
VMLRAKIEATPGAEAALAGIGLGLGALLFAGTLDDHLSIWWPGSSAASSSARSPRPARAAC